MPEIPKETPEAGPRQERTKESEIRANFEFWNTDFWKSRGIGVAEHEIREEIESLPGKEGFSNEINIFANKVMIASFKDQIGVIIESADVAKTQRAVFELAWLGAEKYNQK